MEETGKPKTRDLNIEEKSWVEGHIGLGKLIIKHYFPQDEEITPEVLDKTFKSWREDKNEDKPTKEEVIRGLGCLFGDLFVMKNGWRWKDYVDIAGRTLAVHLDEGNGYYAFPLDSISKRIEEESQDINFFEPIWHNLTNRDSK